MTVGADDVFSYVSTSTQAPPGTTITMGCVSTPPIIVDGDQFPSDPNEENNAAFAVTTVPGGTGTNLAVTKTVDSAQVLPDSNVTYTIQVGNIGQAPSTDAQLNDTLPGDMTFVSLTQTSGPVWTCTTPPATMGEAIVCTNGNFCPGTPQLYYRASRALGASPGRIHKRGPWYSSRTHPENSLRATTRWSRRPA